MTPEEVAEVEQRCFQALTKVLGESYARIETDRVSRALFYLLLRVYNTWRSIRTLRDCTPDPEGCMVDAGALVRVMYEAYLQAEYIFWDPAKRAQRAELYLDYEHVERYNLARKVTQHNNSMANSLKASPHKADGDKRNQEQYDRVKHRYLKKNRAKGGTVTFGPGARDKWYEGDAAQLAEAVGRRDEYDFILSSHHGCIHSSAFAVKGGPMISPEHVLGLASVPAARVARINVNHHQLDVDEDVELLDELAKWID